jgi:hypothetical protein
LPNALLRVEERHCSLEEHHCVMLAPLNDMIAPKPRREPVSVHLDLNRLRALLGSNPLAKSLLEFAARVQPPHLSELYTVDRLHKALKEPTGRSWPCRRPIVRCASSPRPAADICALAVMVRHPVFSGPHQSGNWRRGFRDAAAERNQCPNPTRDAMTRRTTLWICVGLLAEDTQAAPIQS